MTIEEMKNSDKIWLTPAEIAPVVQSDPNLIRWQAHNDPAKLGFPVTVLGCRVKINRKTFLQYLGEIA